MLAPPEAYGPHDHYLAPLPYNTKVSRKKNRIYHLRIRVNVDESYRIIFSCRLYF